MAFSGYDKLSVLVVDDFDNFRMTVNKMLQEFGVKSIDTAVNGNDALAQCRRTHYDLILCDYNLGPGKNGQQILEALRENGWLKSDAVFVLVSAESSKSIVLAAYDAEPDSYLTKPITGKTLQQRLDRLLVQRASMKPIYQALDERQPDKAIELCKSAIASGGRNATSCQKMLGQLYQDTHQLTEAEEVYTKVLEVRPLDWAKIGLAQVKHAQGDSEQARTWLKEIIASNPLAMKAYDSLAETLQSEDQSRELQEVLEQAVKVSPAALLRQQQLAKTAERNHDMLSSAKAYKRSVRLGENSVYDDPNNHLNYARTSMALTSEDDNLGRDLSRDALRSINQLERKQQGTTELSVQCKLIEAQLHHTLGDTNRAEATLTEAKDLLDENPSLQQVDVQLDQVQALKTLGKKQEAQALLDELIEQYAEEQMVMDRIDRILDEPASVENRSKVAQINKKGIQLYDQQQFQDAIDEFDKARGLFPNHVGVQLNLAQALIGEMREYGLEQSSMERALSLLNKIEKNIDNSHKQFNRLRQLKEMLRVVERENRQ